MGPRKKLFLIGLSIILGGLFVWNLSSLLTQSKFRDAEWLSEHWVSSDRITYFKNPKFRSHDSQWKRGPGVVGLTIHYYEFHRKLGWFQRRSYAHPKCSESDVSTLLRSVHVQRVTVRRPPVPFCEGAFIDAVTRKINAHDSDVPATERFGFEVVREGAALGSGNDSGDEVAFDVPKKRVRDFYHLSIACDPKRKQYTFTIRRDPNKTWVDHDRYYVRYRKGGCLDPQHSEGLHAFVQAVMDDSRFE
jgi:hypothetical protein